MTEPTAPLLLIVDDSRMSRMLLKAMVTDLRPDWRIVEASSGDEAIALAQTHRPQFISMDVNMPGTSGLEAAGRIRLAQPDVRIVLCTANIQESTRDAAARAGLHFMAKPITPQGVSAAVAFYEA